MPSRKSESKQIGEHVYVVRQMGGLDARKMLVRLAKMLGAIYGGGNVQQALSSLDELDSEYLFTKMSEHSAVKKEGKEMELSYHFDDHFSGRSFEMMQWLLYTLEVNFPDFLEKLKSIGGSLNGESKGKASILTSPTGATGSSGDS